jgi:hypothetical protein
VITAASQDTALAPYHESAAIPGPRFPPWLGGMDSWLTPRERPCLMFLDTLRLFQDA